MLQSKQTPNTDLPTVETTSDSVQVGPFTTSPRSLLYAITIAAWLIRVGLMLVDGSLFAPIVGDELQFQGLAESLAAGRGFSLDGADVINRMPGYPALLALLYLVTGPSLIAGRLLNSVLSALCVLLAYQLGKQLWGQRVGLAAAALFAINPFNIFWPQFMVSENLQIPLVSLLGVLLVGRESTLLRAQLAGIVAALAILTHPGTVLLVAGALLWYFIYGRSRKFPYSHFLFLVLSLLTLMSFWTVRNWLLVERFVPLTAGVEASGGGFVFWISNNEVTSQPGEHWGRYVSFRDYDKLPDFPEYSSLPSDDPALLDRKGYEYGWRFITSQPDKVPMLLLGKLLNFWEIELSTRSSRNMVPLLGLIFWPLYLLGLVLHWRKSLQSKIVVAFIGSALLIALIFWGSARFRAPAEVFFVLCMTVGIAQVSDWVRQIAARRPPAANEVQ